MNTIYPEIENLVPPKLLRGFLIDRLNIAEAKADGIVAHSYKKVKLGKFLSDQFGKYNINKKVAAKTGGTLTNSYKLLLAGYVLNQVAGGKYNWKDLAANEVVAELIPKLYQFIYLHNK